MVGIRKRMYPDRLAQLNTNSLRFRKQGRDFIYTWKIQNGKLDKDMGGDILTVSDSSTRGHFADILQSEENEAYPLYDSVLQNGEFMEYSTC